MIITYENDPYVRIKPRIEKLDKSKIKTVVTAVEKEEQDGQYVDKIVYKELTPDMDPRKDLVVEDFALSVVLANEGIGALKECPKLNGSTFDNIDKISDTIEQLETYKEDL